MSYNTEPERAAKRHPAPIIAIVLALLVAIAAGVWWMGAEPTSHGDVSRVESTAAPAVETQDVAPTTPTADTPASGAAPQPSTPASN